MVKLIIIFSFLSPSLSAQFGLHPYGQSSFGHKPFGQSDFGFSDQGDTDPLYYFTLGANNAHGKIDDNSDFTGGGTVIIDFWVDDLTLPSDADGRRIFGQGDENLNRRSFNVFLYQAGFLEFYISSNGNSGGARAIRKSKIVGLDDGEPHHIYCEFVGSTTQSIYIDGVNQDSTLTGTIQASANNSTDDIFVGYREFGPEYMSACDITEIRVTNKAYTASELAFAANIDNIGSLPPTRSMSDYDIRLRPNMVFPAVEDYANGNTLVLHCEKVDSVISGDNLLIGGVLNDGTTTYAYVDNLGDGINIYTTTDANLENWSLDSTPFATDGARTDSIPGEPWVVKVNEEFTMFYVRGNVNAITDTVWYATSNSYNGTYTEQAAIINGTGAGWNDHDTDKPRALFNTSDNTWYVYYEASAITTNNEQVGFNRGASLTTLLEYINNPVLSGTHKRAGAPYLTSNGGVFVIHSNTDSNIRMAYAPAIETDEYTLHTKNLVATGSGGTFDDAAVKGPVVYSTSTIAYVFYSGYDGSTHSVGLSKCSSTFELINQ